MTSTIEYRVCIRRHGVMRHRKVKTFDKAQKTVEDAYIDFNRYRREIRDAMNPSAWIEKRTVTDWVKT